MREKSVYNCVRILYNGVRHTLAIRTNVSHQCRVFSFDSRCFHRRSFCLFIVPFVNVRQMYTNKVQRQTGFVLIVIHRRFCNIHNNCQHNKSEFIYLTWYKSRSHTLAHLPRAHEISSTAKFSRAHAPDVSTKRPAEWCVCVWSLERDAHRTYVGLKKKQNKTCLICIATVSCLTSQSGIGERGLVLNSKTEIAPVAHFRSIRRQSTIRESSVVLLNFGILHHPLRGNSLCLRSKRFWTRKNQWNYLFRCNILPLDENCKCTFNLVITSFRSQNLLSEYTAGESPVGPVFPHIARVGNLFNCEWENWHLLLAGLLHGCCAARN